MTLWWLSFADGNLPKGSQFLGVAVVSGFDMMEAVQNAHILKCNPGGEVLGAKVPNGIKIPKEYMNRVLAKEEALNLEKLINQQQCN